jgi:hypothetical protein
MLNVQKLILLVLKKVLVAGKEVQLDPLDAGEHGQVVGQEGVQDYHGYMV